MCFSAGASFVASGVTAVAGMTALGMARRPADRLLAAIPLCFAAQQFMEGVLWLSLAGPVDAAWRAPAMFGFLAVAKVAWPTWVPLAVRGVEGDPGRRRLLSALLVLGVVESALAGFALLAFPVAVEVAGGHLKYSIGAPPLFRVPADLLYYAVTLLPALVSSRGMIRGVGVVVLASLAVTELLYHSFVVSVWCFFAAVLSALVVLVVRGLAGGAPARSAGRAPAR